MIVVWSETVLLCKCVGIGGNRLCHANSFAFFVNLMYDIMFHESLSVLAGHPAGIFFV